MAMTEQPTQDQAPTAPPKLVHSGVYTLWETPGGGRLLAYKRLTTVDEAGQVLDVPEPTDERLPHIPAEALPLVSVFLDQGIPPQILQVLAAGGKGRLGAIRALLGQLSAAAAVPADDGQLAAAEDEPLPPLPWQQDAPQAPVGGPSRAAGDDFGITED